MDARHRKAYRDKRVREELDRDDLLHIVNNVNREYDEQQSSILAWRLFAALSLLCIVIVTIVIMMRGGL